MKKGAVDGLAWKLIIVILVIVFAIFVATQWGKDTLESLTDEAQDIQDEAEETQDELDEYIGEAVDLRISPTEDYQIYNFDRPYVHQYLWSASSMLTHYNAAGEDRFDDDRVILFYLENLGSKDADINVQILSDTTYTQLSGNLLRDPSSTNHPYIPQLPARKHAYVYVEYDLIRAEEDIVICVEATNYVESDLRDNCISVTLDTGDTCEQSNILDPNPCAYYCVGEECTGTRCSLKYCSSVLTADKTCTTAELLQEIECSGQSGCFGCEGSNGGFYKSGQTSQGWLCYGGEWGYCKASTVGDTHCRATVSYECREKNSVYFWCLDDDTEPCNAENLGFQRCANNAAGYQVCTSSGNWV